MSPLVQTSSGRGLNVGQLHILTTILEYERFGKLSTIMSEQDLAAFRSNPFMSILPSSAKPELQFRWLSKLALTSLNPATPTPGKFIYQLYLAK